MGERGEGGEGRRRGDGRLFVTNFEMTGLCPEDFGVTSGWNTGTESAWISMGPVDQERQIAALLSQPTQLLSNALNYIDVNICTSWMTFYPASCASTTSKECRIQTLRTNAHHTVRMFKNQIGGAIYAEEGYDPETLRTIINMFVDRNVIVKDGNPLLDNHLLHEYELSCSTLSVVQPGFEHMTKYGPVTHVDYALLDTLEADTFPIAGEKPWPFVESLCSKHILRDSQSEVIHCEGPKHANLTSGSGSQRNMSDFSSEDLFSSLQSTKDSPKPDSC